MNPYDTFMKGQRANPYDTFMKGQRASNPEDTEVTEEEIAEAESGYDSGDARTEYGRAVIRLSGGVSAKSAKRNLVLMEKFMSDEEIAITGKVSFLGSTSVKVLHSAEELGWLNVVQYLAPANRASYSMLSLFPHFRTPSAKNGFLTDERGNNYNTRMNDAATIDPMWLGFRASDKAKPQMEHNASVIRAMHKSSIDIEHYHKDDFTTNFLNLCPFASKDCRSVCLNTSGKGGAKSPVVYTREVAEPARLAGERHTEDPRHMLLRGRTKWYGGAENSTIGARLRRTHIMMLSWLREGVIHNTYNLMLYLEAEAFYIASRKDTRVHNNVKGRGMMPPPLALRFNGTSDIPFHTLTFTHPETGKKMNLMLALANLGGSSKGFTCYDYTKHFAKAWQMITNVPKGTYIPLSKGRAKMVGNFPSNYYAAFSRSEVNGEQCSRILIAGGNVVGVIRRTREELSGKKGSKIKVSAMGSIPARMKDQYFYIPTEIRLVDFDPSFKSLDATTDVISGDKHDLRFLDPNNIGIKNGGYFVALIAKGKARDPFKGVSLPESGRYPTNFTTPTFLDEDEMGYAKGSRPDGLTRRIIARPSLRGNPESVSTEGAGAVVEVSAKVATQTAHVIKSHPAWAFVPTGMGT